MDKKNIGGIIVVVAIIAIILLIKPSFEAEEGASIKIDIRVVEPPKGFTTQAIVTGPKTVVDVETLPFSLTIFNDGGIDFSNIGLGPGTIPGVLNNAFTGLRIDSLPAGESRTITANVDVASLAPTTGSRVFNFQAHIIGDYEVAGETFTKIGFSEVMELTVSPGAGLTVDIVYE